MNDSLFTGEQPIVALDVNFASIDARYKEGDRAGQLILPNSRPGYIATRLAESGIGVIFFRHDDPTGYDTLGLKRYTIAPDLSNPETYKTYDLPPDQRLVPHAMRVRDGIHPDLHRRIPGYNSARFCGAMQNRSIVQDRLCAAGVGAVGVFGAFAQIQEGRTMAEHSGDSSYVVRPARVGISREEHVMSLDEMRQSAAGDRPYSIGNAVLMQHIEQAPFETVARMLCAQEAAYDENDRHSLVLYTHGRDTYAAELQKADAKGGCWKTTELFSAEEIRSRIPHLWEQNRTAVSTVARRFAARSSSYGISYQLGANASEDWYVSEVNPRPYTPDLNVGSDRQQAIAETTVMAGEVRPLQKLTESAYNSHPKALVTLRYR